MGHGHFALGTSTRFADGPAETSLCFRLCNTVAQAHHLAHQNQATRQSGLGAIINPLSSLLQGPVNEHHDKVRDGYETHGADETVTTNQTRYVLYSLRNPSICRFNFTPVTVVPEVYTTATANIQLNSRALAKPDMEWRRRRRQGSIRRDTLHPACRSYIPICPAKPCIVPPKPHPIPLSWAAYRPIADRDPYSSAEAPDHFRGEFPPASLQMRTGTPNHKHISKSTLS